MSINNLYGRGHSSPYHHPEHGEVKKKKKPVDLPPIIKTSGETIPLDLDYRHDDKR